MKGNVSMMEKLVQFFEESLSFMDYMDTPKGRQIYQDQAFGAMRFAQTLVEDDSKLIALWNEWKPKFEEKVWGC